MAKYLVIVESPAKSKTIENYLGDDYKVVSSKGHIRDLSTKGKLGLGVDLENKFKPDYIYKDGKKKVVTDLKKELKNISKVYLATDPDREGEAISWHLYDALELTDDNYDRVVFNEITKNAVKEAFNNPRKIDMDLVNSQETRRILDRIIGFRLSKLIQSKTDGSSAGRVQSVAIKLIVDREREIMAFKEEEYYTIEATFDDFNANLFKYKADDIEIKSNEEADKILGELSNTFKVDSVTEKEKSKKAKPVFITSTLQQEASIKLSMSPKKTMMIAQKLYEGVTLSNETVGLITYMRTDSTRLSDDFIKDTYQFIKDNYGSNYVGNYKIKNSKDNVQDAHEGIRPTSIKRTPESVKEFLTSDEYKLYHLIYSRALASLMSDLKTNNKTIILDNNDYKFKATGQVITFDGYQKVYSMYEDSEEVIIKDLKTDTLISDLIEKIKHLTKPKPRYTEAKLIKEMEEDGIGRPSTYAMIIDNIKERGYVKVEDKKFVPTEIGFEVTDKLQECFNHIINIEYTAKMEEDLDKISLGKIVWYNVLDDFYKKFEPAVKEAFLKLPKKEAEKTGEICPLCNSELVIRKGKYGAFTACSNYPACKYVKKEEKQVVEICDCPKCGGKIIEKPTRKGKVFYGCNNYPKCKEAYWNKPTGEICSTCNNLKTESKNGIISCEKCKDKE